MSICNERSFNLTHFLLGGLWHAFGHAWTKIIQNCKLLKDLSLLELPYSQINYLSDLKRGEWFDVTWLQTSKHFDCVLDTEYILDFLWGQPIKLIQVAYNSELRENQWNDLLFFKIVPSHCFGASEASKNDCLKIKLVMIHFLFVLLRPHRNDREQF